MNTYMIWVLFIFLMLAGCKARTGKISRSGMDTNDIQNTGYSGSQTSPQKTLIFLDQAWLLNHMDALDEEIRNQIWIRFDSGEPYRFIGFTSCNRFFGTYSLKGDSIILSEIASTKKMCPAIKLETFFLDRLEMVCRVEMDGDQLILLDQDDQKMLFEKTDLDIMGDK